MTQDGKQARRHPEHVFLEVLKMFLVVPDLLFV